MHKISVELDRSFDGQTLDLTIDVPALSAVSIELH